VNKTAMVVAIYARKSTEQTGADVEAKSVTNQIATAARVESMRARSLPGANELLRGRLAVRPRRPHALRRHCSHSAAGMRFHGQMK
jgi:hypothetical protein